jgi:hypothetical protein
LNARQRRKARRASERVAYVEPTAAGGALALEQLLEFHATAAIEILSAPSSIFRTEFDRYPVRSRYVNEWEVQRRRFHYERLVTSRAYNSTERRLVINDAQASAGVPTDVERIEESWYADHNGPGVRIRVTLLERTCGRGWTEECRASFNHEAPYTLARALPASTSSINEEQMLRLVGEQHERYMQAFRKRAEDFKAAQARASARAESLLRRFLSPAQREQLDNQNWFHVTSQHGRAYRIYRVNTYNVERLADGARLCAVPAADMPLADRMLAQMLMLRFREDEFLATADVSRSRAVGADFGEAARACGLALEAAGQACAHAARAFEDFHVQLTTADAERLAEQYIGLMQ